MKRLFTLIVLLSLVIGAVTGCNDNKDTTPPAGGTNATPSAPSTNK